MFSLRSKKELSLNYPQYPLLSGALICWSYLANGRGWEVAGRADCMLNVQGAV